MRVRQQLVLGEPAELLADQLQRVVLERPVAQPVLLDQRGQARPAGGIVAPDQGAYRGGAKGIDGIVVQAERAQPDDLALAHRNAALDARQIFAERDREDQLLEVAQPARLLQARGPSLHLAQRLDIGCKPGEPVRGMLVTLEPLGIGRAARCDQGTHAIGRPRQQDLGGIERSTGRCQRCLPSGRFERRGHGRDPI